MDAYLGKNECPPPPLTDTEQQEENTHSLGSTYCWAPPAALDSTHQKPERPRHVPFFAAPCVTLKATPDQQTCDLSAGTQLIQTQGPGLVPTLPKVRLVS